MTPHFQKLKRRFARSKTKQINVTKIISLASSLSVAPSHLDINSQCFKLELLSNTVLDEALIESLYQSKLPSFQSFATSSNLKINKSDLTTLMSSHGNYVNDIVQITGRSQEQVLIDFANYFEGRKILVQPTVLSGIIHKFTNSAFVMGSALQTAVCTAGAHVSGVTGISFLGTTPGLVIFVPLVGGVFFGALERLAANTPAQPVLIIARDTCLLTPKIGEIVYNEILVGPILRRFGIDAPLNVTSMLKFGTGTKLVMGGLLNATLSSLFKAVPSNFVG